MIFPVTRYRYLSRPTKQAEPEPARVRGLGDVVALVAHPAAVVIDLAIGTNLRNCGGCSERQEKWNQAVPFGHHV